MNKVLFFLIAILNFLFVTTLFAETSSISGKVVTVTDGDTLKVKHSGKVNKIRLYGVDCPEKRQEFGIKATKFTADLVYGKIVTVNIHARDKYGRYIGDVILADGRVLNAELLKEGLAWWYRRYAPKSDLLKNLEQNAKRQKKGLWIKDGAVPPWEFRKLKKNDSYTNFSPWMRLLESLLRLLLE